MFVRDEFWVARDSFSPWSPRTIDSQTRPNNRVTEAEGSRNTLHDKTQTSDESSAIDKFSIRIFSRTPFSKGYAIHRSPPSTFSSLSVALCVHRDSQQSCHEPREKQEEMEIS